MFIDNEEVTRRGTQTLPTLEVKQHQVLVYDLCTVTKRLKGARPCKIRWQWIKGHRVQKQNNWKLDITIKQITDRKAEMARDFQCTEELDPFFLIKSYYWCIS